MKIRFYYALIFALSFLYTQCKNSQKPQKTVESEHKTADISTIANDFSTAISNSPRHHEWITLSSNGRELYTFVAYPETSKKAKAVIVIHENRGLNEWARYFTDQLAAQGYVVLAPDLLSNFKEGIKKNNGF